MGIQLLYHSLAFISILSIYSLVYFLEKPVNCSTKHKKQIFNPLRRESGGSPGITQPQLTLTPQSRVQPAGRFPYPGKLLLLESTKVWLPLLKPERAYIHNFSRVLHHFAYFYIPTLIISLLTGVFKVIRVHLRVHPYQNNRTIVRVVSMPLR